jgi:hypothetical protein
VCKYTTEVIITEGSEAPQGTGHCQCNRPPRPCRHWCSHSGSLDEAWPAFHSFQAPILSEIRLGIRLHC